jgi:hypothetical protein
MRSQQAPNTGVTSPNPGSPSNSGLAVAPLADPEAPQPAQVVAAQFRVWETRGRSSVIKELGRTARP